jgi:mono/diheme cytochrome c family protein
MKSNRYSGEGTTNVHRQRIGWIAIAFLLAVACVAADGTWFAQVPEADRRRESPYAGQPEAKAGGAQLFADHCSKCHGADALGRGKEPSLRTKEVQTATDGEIFWLLRNGNRRRGMPSWSSLPEPSRWQLVAYVKSLGESNE